MARKFEDRLAEVRDAVADPKTPAHRQRLVKTLGGQQGYLISVAAAALTPDDPELVTAACEAFERLLEDPIKRDPQCHGKAAIASALYDAEIRAEATFLAGVAHVQLEPVLGGRQDTAAHLRGVSLMALVHGQHPRAITCAGAMLADPERSARLAALRALSACNQPEAAEPLLRLRLELGDEDPEVLSDCMAALLEVSPAENLAVVGARLRGADATAAEAAALALGTSRVAGAFEVLRDHLQEDFVSDRRRTLFVALAMLRSDVAWQYLIEVIMDGGEGAPADAIDALATFKEHGGLRERVEAAAMDRGDAEIQAHFERAFDST
ncbi:MAG: hypothetical protein AAF721_30905 [Myxococcota bacterium]